MKISCRECFLTASLVEYRCFDKDYTRLSRLGRRFTGVAHSKITRVRVLSWPLPVLTSLYFLTVTKSCHTKFSMNAFELYESLQPYRRKKHKSTYHHYHAFYFRQQGP